MDVFEVISVGIGIVCIPLFVVGMIQQIKSDYKVLGQRRNAKKQIDISVNGKTKKATFDSKQGSITFSEPLALAVGDEITIISS